MTVIANVLLTERFVAALTRPRVRCPNKPTVPDRMRNQSRL